MMGFAHTAQRKTEIKSEWVSDSLHTGWLVFMHICFLLFRSKMNEISEICSRSIENHMETNKISNEKYEFRFEFRQNSSNWITLWLVGSLLSSGLTTDAYKHAHIHTHTRTTRRELRKLEIRIVVSQSYYVVRNIKHTHTRSMQHTQRIVVLFYRWRCVWFDLEIGYVPHSSLHLAYSCSLRSSKAHQTISLSQRVCVCGSLYAHEFVVLCCAVYAESMRPQRHTHTQAHTHTHTGIEKVTLFFHNSQTTSTSNIHTSQQHRIGHCVHFVMMSRLDCS